MWVALRLGRRPLSWSEYKCSIVGPFVFPEEAARYRAHFLEWTSDSAFLFERSPNQPSLPLTPAWMDRNGQADSPEEGDFVAVIIL